jgi:microcystin degradation protein MlrC
LIRQGVKSAAVGTVYDPQVVAEAIDVGVGGRMTTSLGAKTDNLHGGPLDIEATVVSVWDGRFQYKGPMTTGSWASLGDCAVLDVGGIKVIVASKRLQCRDPEIFRAAGIDPLEMDILVVKSAVHFRAAFEPFAARVILADGPGLTSLDLTQFDYKRIRRPLFPLDRV